MTPLPSSPGSKAPGIARTAATADHVDTARAFVNQLARLRAAGDMAGAIAYAKQTLGAHSAGSGALLAMELAMFNEVALQNRLSPDLFLFLASRFDWRNDQGRVARGDPQRHAAVLTRIAAEEWLLELHRGARTAKGRVAALLLAPHERALKMLAARPLDLAERAQVRALFEQLLAYAGLVLIRFDGATLALLREAVEDVPLPAAAPASHATSRRAVQLTVALVVLALVSGLIWWKVRGRDPHASATSMAVSRAVSAGLGVGAADWAPAGSRS